MSESKPNYAGKLFVGAFVYALGFLAYYAGTAYWVAYLFLIPISIWIEVGYQLIVCTNKEPGYARHCVILVVSAYMASFVAYHLSTTPQGAVFLGLVVCMVVAFDTFSQVGGVAAKRFVDTHPIAKKESKNKTVEGTVVGYTVSIITGAVVSSIFYEDLIPWGTNGIMIGMLVAFVPAVAFLGDINESMAKRRLIKWDKGELKALKDFSKALWPVGGVSDRYDGMILAVSIIGGIFDVLMLLTLV